MKRAASLLLCALLMVALLCTPVSAASSDAGYTIETYDVEATLEQDGSMQITERIGVNFELPSRGIFRAFPTSVQMEKETGGTTKVLRYTPKISVVSANDVVTTYTENGIFYIRFGTEDAWHQGAQEYEVQYTYDPGADRVPEYDELFYSFNGADWDTTIASFHFVLNFPKKTDTAALALFSGAYGVQDNDAIDWTCDGITLEGRSNRMLGAGEAVTMDLRLPEGYYTGVREFSPMPAILILVPALLCAVAALVLRAKCRRQRVVDTVEFYPPEGVTSADVGLIVDGVANDKDILSLIIWFADGGFLSIAGKGDELTLTRLKEADPAWQTATRTVWNGLFGNGSDTVNLASLEEDFYNVLQAAKASLTNHYAARENRLSSGGMSAAGVLLVILAACSGLGSILLCGAQFAPILTALALAVFVLSVMGGIAGVATIQARRFWSDGKQLAMKLLLWGLRAAVVLLCLVAAAASIAPAWIPLAAAAALVLVTVGVSGMAKLTPLGAELTGKLLGLRNFIEKAELDRLKLLVDENPEYFYHVLPYAYVFGLSDQWSDQFEKLATPPPSWYYGGQNDLFTTVWLTRSLTRSFAHVQSSAMEASMNKAMSSGGAGGTGFGGGGGFSGGGFGGGGGGRW